MRDECIPFLLSEQLLEVIEERKAFFIGDAREGIIGVLALEVDDQPRELMVFAKLGYRIRKRFPADDGGEIPMGLSMAIKRLTSMETGVTASWCVHSGLYLYSYQPMISGDMGTLSFYPSLQICCPP